MPVPQASDVLAVFAGSVTCQRHSAGLTLRGIVAADEPEGLILTFIGVTDEALPETLTGVRVRATGGQTYRLESAARDWTIRARAVHVHRDVGTAFYRAVPPRPAPLGKRLFWRTVLWLAARRSGLRLLRALRGR